MTFTLLHRLALAALPAALLAWNGTATAQGAPVVDSRISAVKLYPGSATVERTARVPAGSRSVTFDCLPAGLDARSVQVLEAILDQQIGDQFGFLRDRLLSQVRADLGGFFYIPSQADLGLPEVPTPKRAETDWARFPGVDWSRLDRHFTQRSINWYEQKFDKK